MDVTGTQRRGFQLRTRGWTVGRGEGRTSGRRGGLQGAGEGKPASSRAEQSKGRVERKAPPRQEAGQGLGGLGPTPAQRGDVRKHRHQRV